MSSPVPLRQRAKMQDLPTLVREQQTASRYVGVEMDVGEGGGSMHNRLVQQRLDSLRIGTFSPTRQVTRSSPRRGNAWIGHRDRRLCPTMDAFRSGGEHGVVMAPAFMPAERKRRPRRSGSEATERRAPSTEQGPTKPSQRRGGALSRVAGHTAGPGQTQRMFAGVQTERAASCVTPSCGGK